MPEAPLPLLVSLAFLTIILLLCQGVHIVRTGAHSPFFMDDQRDLRDRALGPAQRWFDSLLYFLPAGGIVALLIVAVLRRGSGSLLHWFRLYMGTIFWLVIFGAAGILYLTVPSRMLRWSLSGRGIDPPYNLWLTTLARFIGAVFLIVVLALTSKM